MLTDKLYDLTKNAETVTLLSSNLSNYIVQHRYRTSIKEVSFGKESIIFDIYVKAVKNLVSKSINKSTLSGLDFKFFVLSIN